MSFKNRLKKNIAQSLLEYVLLLSLSIIAIIVATRFWNLRDNNTHNFLLNASFDRTVSVIEGESN